VTDGEEYVTDLKGYEGPIDRVSPYHFYMHAYWNLRSAWRRRLYAWTRRDPCDASASIRPDQTVAASRQTLTLSVTVGKTPLRAGARIAVYFPLHVGGEHWFRAPMVFQGPEGQTGYGSRIVGRTEKQGVELRTIVHSTGSVFTCVEVIVRSGELVEGDRLDVVIGHPSCKRPTVSEQAKSFPFRVAIDFAGDDTFRPIVPNPTVRNVGGAARYLRCFAPPTPTHGDPFALRVVAADLANHNPSHSYAGRVELEAAEGALGGTSEADTPADAHGTAQVDGVIVPGNGVTRIQVLDRTNGLMGQANPVCPDAAPDGLSLYYGEIHSHTELSDGGGLPEDSFRWARDVEGLDFAALADHFEDGQSYNYTLEDKWRITREQTEAFHEPGRFVTLLGYEIGTLEAHRNVYFADGEGRMIVEGPGGERVTMDNVFRKLAGTDYVLIPHAPKFHGIHWHRPHEPGRQRLVEVFSYWGDSEAGGPQSVRHALDLGYRFGFTGGTDNHVAAAGNPDIGGITGVWAPELTRRAIFDALRARRTFATSGPRMILTLELNGTWMGGEVAAEPSESRQLRARAITCEPVESIDVIRNGEVVHRTAGQGADTTLEWEDTEPLAGLLPERELSDDRFAYYYVRVRTVTGAKGWVSPVWVFEERKG
jgi:hypothetical protein